MDRGVVVAEVGGVAAHLGAGGGGGQQRGRGVDEAVVGRDLLLARGGGEQPAGAAVVTSVGWKKRARKSFVRMCAERKWDCDEMDCRALDSFKMNFDCNYVNCSIA